MSDRLRLCPTQFITLLLTQRMLFPSLYCIVKNITLTKDLMCCKDEPLPPVGIQTIGSSFRSILCHVCSLFLFDARPEPVYFFNNAYFGPILFVQRPVLALCLLKTLTEHARALRPAWSIFPEPSPACFCIKSSPSLPCFSLSAKQTGRAVRKSCFGRTPMVRDGRWGTGPIRSNFCTLREWSLCVG